MAGKNTKIVTDLVRFAYVNVWRPVAFEGGEEKYGVSIIISKRDENTMDKIIMSVNKAMENGKKKLEGIPIENIIMPIRDGDAERDDDEAYADSYFINAYTLTKPQVVDENRNHIEDESEFYSGCYGRASITFYAYKHDGKAGIACGLRNVQKLRDGEVLKGYGDAKFEFLQDYHGDYLD